MRNILAADIGGTFIDVVTYNNDKNTLEFEKGFTLPDQLISSVENTIKKTESSIDTIQTFVHGTTLGLNTCLQLNGAKTGILTNRGFEDIFEMGRYNRDRTQMYSLVYDVPPLLVPKVLRRGVAGRINSKGEIIVSLDEKGVLDEVYQLVNLYGVESIAVCFLHSYRNPVHEQRASELIKESYPELSVSISSDIVREYREYERTSTTVLNAYIQPVFERYIISLENSLNSEGFRGDFFITRSGGGAMVASDAKHMPVHTIFSGPAGGLIGAERLSELLHMDKLLTFDMGGTSTDCCVVDDGKTSLKYESSISNIPFLVPTFDLSTIGAGGGSIAAVDNGVLKVGPRSAGAEPGPICYGRGGREPTITDSMLALGLIDAGSFLGGTYRLDVEAAKKGLKHKVGDLLQLDVSQAARGIIEVLIAKTVSAVREITVERGLDPREFSFLAFGGAGPLIGPLVARELNVQNIVIPQVPSVFSAWGMLMTDIVYESTQTFSELLTGNSLGQIKQSCENYGIKTPSKEIESGSPPEIVEYSLAMRYFGQEHNLYIPFYLSDDPELIRLRFDQLHQRRYGHSMPDPLEIVHLRVQRLTKTEKPTLAKQDLKRKQELMPACVRNAYCFAQNEFVEFSIYFRDDLLFGDQIIGPAIVQEDTTATLILSDQTAEIDEYGHIIITQDNQH